MDSPSNSLSIMLENIGKNMIDFILILAAFFIIIDTIAVIIGIINKDKDYFYFCLVISIIIIVLILVSCGKI